MKSKCWLLLLVPVMIVPFLIWGYDRMTGVYAIGIIDLLIEYQVVDSATGHSIPQARVDFRDDEGSTTSRGFIVADSSGMAQHDFPDATISTQSSGLNWTVHHAVYLPSWSYSVSAPGYFTSDWRDLYESRRETLVTENRKAKMTISVRLKKKQ